MFKIIYAGGTKGAFLCYFLCKFSNFDIDIENPFAPDGTVHKAGQAGVLPQFHEDFIQDNPEKENLSLVVLSLNTWTHYLYYLLSCKIRAGNTGADPDYLWQKSKDECKKIKGLEEDIWNLQNMHYTNHNKSKFSKKEIRNWYKQHFDNRLENFAMYKSHKNFENNPWFKKQNVYKIDFEAFFDWKIFRKEIENADGKLNIGIDFTREKEMIELYKKSIEKDYIIAQCIEINHIVKRIYSKEHVSIPDLNVVCEAYLLSQIEKAIKRKLDIGEKFYTSTKGLF